MAEPNPLTEAQCLLRLGIPEVNRFEAKLLEHP